jgi:Na+-transporting methylmalonyl-CoA/oxaloacetate decarboxylase beta subunit
LGAKQTAKAATREDVKKAKKTKEEQVKKTERIRVRIIPIWARILLVLVFMAVSALVGIVIGYGVIGSGNPADAFDQSTWQHIIDLVEKE